MADNMDVPPALSTPATHIFEDDVSPAQHLPARLHSPEQIHIRYEIDRTVAEIKQGRWKRIALQFPDCMLPDAPNVFQRLSRQLNGRQRNDGGYVNSDTNSSPLTSDQSLHTVDDLGQHKLFILGDTSYGACCVDEVAAEHVNADVVVHYGRACLSPTAKLPVIHIFTHQSLAIDPLLEHFKSVYSNHDQSIILMSDVTYASHLQHIGTTLKNQGYSSIFTTDVVHDPSSPIPNRTIPECVGQSPEKLREWRLFHVSEPPEALLLTLASRVSDIHIYSTESITTTQGAGVSSVSSKVALRRRYALLTSVSTAAIFGILINTLSVRNYLEIVEHVKSCINAAGKKSYTFVVGKINAAKVANFSEIGAWVVVGCWESSLVDNKDFWKPIITPFELELALASDQERIWTGEWQSDFQKILEDAGRGTGDGDLVHANKPIEGSAADLDHRDYDSESESAPPEFDLRTGRYVSHSRPMQARLNLAGSSSPNSNSQIGGSALAVRTKGGMVSIGNQASPGADFLRSNRTWQGLGSDFEIGYDLAEVSDSVTMEEGRSGLPRGYLSAHSVTQT